MSIITLIGIMCSGKTTIGEELGKITQKEHFDTDHIIEKNMSIPEIFCLQGEERFRRLEYGVTSELIRSNKDCIISVGGGAFIQNSVRHLLLENTLTVWLKVNLNTVLQRLKADKKNNRPLARLLDVKFLQERNQKYKEAKLHIVCDKLQPQEIANFISLFIDMGRLFYY